MTVVQFDRPKAALAEADKKVGAAQEAREDAIRWLLSCLDEDYSVTAIDALETVGAALKELGKADDIYSEAIDVWYDLDQKDKAHAVEGS